MVATLPPAPVGIAPSAQTFTGNIPAVPGAGAFPHMLPSSHPLPQMVPSTDIAPSMPSMGVMLPPDPSMTQRYFGTSMHNAAPGIAGEAAPKHPTFGDLPGLGSFPKPAGSSGPQMSIPHKCLERTVALLLDLSAIHQYLAHHPLIMVLAVLAWLDHQCVEK